MKVVLIKDVIGVNEALTAQGVAAKVHLHDACGGQTLSLESLDGTSATLNAAHRVVQEYFDGQGITIAFDATAGTTFHAV